SHPLTADACRWVIRHDCSSEARRRHEQGHFLVQGRIGFEASQQAAKPPSKPDTPMPKADEGKRPSPSEKKETGRPVKFQAKVPEVQIGMRQTGEELPLVTSGQPPKSSGEWTDNNTLKLKLQGGDLARHWFQSALDLEPRLTALGPAFGNDPAI